jgi:hypothetical protein
MGSIYMALLFLGLVVGAFLFRGGLSLWLVGMALVDRDGAPATRARCALRKAVAWLPVLGLLISGLILDWRGEPSEMSAGLRIAGFVLILAGSVDVLLRPSRTIADRLAGVIIVPR